MRITLCLVLLMLALASASHAQTAQLRIESDPPGASVFVDRVLVGTTPLDHTVTPGSHLVRVSVDASWFPHSETVVLQPGETRRLQVRLQRSAQSWYDEGLQAWRSAQPQRAMTAFHASLRAPGKQVADASFYLGLLELQQSNPQAAVDHFRRFAGLMDRSPSVHYQLGLALDMSGQTGPAATAFKAALLRLSGQIGEALKPPPAGTSAEVRRLLGQSGWRARVRLGYAYELKGMMAEARDTYRALFDELTAGAGVDIENPQPDGVPVTLP